MMSFPPSTGGLAVSSDFVARAERAAASAHHLPSRSGCGR